MNTAKLISKTEPLDGMTGEELIAYLARVSSPNQRKENSERLLVYLMKHQHWSPFAMADMTVEIVTSRAIMAQVLRHYSFEFQEFSMRYSEVGEIDWSFLEIREKHEEGNRQGSGDANIAMSNFSQTQCERVEDDYKFMIEKGAAPESARMIMPLATPTRAYMKGSVRSWITYFWQRLDAHAQKEHRELAQAIFEVFESEFPVIAKLTQEYKPVITKLT